MENKRIEHGIHSEHRAPDHIEQLLDCCSVSNSSFESASKSVSRVGNNAIYSIDYLLRYFRS